MKNKKNDLQQDENLPELHLVETRQNTDSKKNDTNKEDLSSEEIEEVEEVEEVEDQDPLISCVSRFIHSVNDVEEAINIFVPLAEKRDEQQQQEITEAFNEAEKYAKDNSPSSQALSSSLFTKAIKRADRYVHSQVPNILIKSFFLNVFSDFDTFTGEMLIAIYNKKPELFNSISKTVPLSEIIKCDDINKLKDKILLDEIESFRRKSYVEQFDTLEKQFGLKTLRDFKNWPKFVEATQRRNLFMHCDAIVSEQYIKICSENSCVIKESIGDKLYIDKDYFDQVLNLMREVAIKLANVLWRKVLPEEIEKSDDALLDITFDCLSGENWDLAITIGDFIRNTARSKTELMQRINTINLVIAQKHSGNNKIAQKILHSLDWSASILDFRLSVAILEDDYQNAASLMIKLGTSGDLIIERSYLEWPLFKDFRQSEEFLNAYETIYGYSFIRKMQENAYEYEKEVDEKEVNVLENKSIVIETTEETTEEIRD